MRPRDVPAHPAIGEPAARDRTNDRRDLPVERGRDPGEALTDAELRLQDRRHPVAHDPPGQRRQREVEHQQHERAVAKQLSHRASGRRPRRRRISAAGRIAQEQKSGSA